MSAFEAHVKLASHIVDQLAQNLSVRFSTKFSCSVELWNHFSVRKELCLGDQFLLVLSTKQIFVTPMASGAAGRANVGLCPASSFYFFPTIDCSTVGPSITIKYAQYGPDHLLAKPAHDRFRRFCNIQIHKHRDHRTCDDCSNRPHQRDAWITNRERNCADTTGKVLVPWAGHFQCYNINQIKYTETMLSNSTRKLSWFEITKTLTAALKKINLLCHSL